jgi:hypothetical protein
MIRLFLVLHSKFFIKLLGPLPSFFYNMVLIGLMVIIILIFLMIIRIAVHILLSFKIGTFLLALVLILGFVILLIIILGGPTASITIITSSTFVTLCRLPRPNMRVVELIILFLLILVRKHFVRLLN